MLQSLRLALAASLLWLIAGPASAQPPMWTVTSGHSTLILFGSVHLLPPGLNWEPPKLKRAVKQAREIWFEIPLDNASMSAAAEAAEREGLQPPGQTLSAELSDADRAHLTRLAQTYAVPMAELDRLKPWLAEIRLSVASYRELGAGRDDGVEHQLLAGLNAKARRRAFETPEQQIAYLAGSPPADQIASLEETFGELDEGPSAYRKLVAAWVAGDLAGLDALALQPMIQTAPGVYRALVVERNRRWIAAIVERLKSPGDAVIVVGVGHLIGPDGLPALLRARGIRVDGPS
jgi:uncharacterized protein YbaP (TraB family)